MEICVEALEKVVQELQQVSKSIKEEVASLAKKMDDGFKLLSLEQ